MTDPALVALADTDESRRVHHRLRYAVYCQRLRYEEPERFPDNEERDEYDEAAVHSSPTTDRIGPARCG